ncbi:MAG: PKD domain-containing protein, partial [Vicingus serpentipes]|nr:PKD domain-containing protein [Vicingus serpentipes]
MRIVFNLLLLVTMQGIYAQCDLSDPNYNPCATNTTAEINGVLGRHENHQAVYHAQMIKTSTGYLVTGSDMSSTGGGQIGFTAIPGPGYNMGSAFPVFGTIGDEQSIFLGSDGKFYALGGEDKCIPTSMTSSNSFQEITLALPVGVTVCDVVKMHATNKMLSLLTSTGDLYVMGDNAVEVESSVVNPTVFTQVTMPAGLIVVDYQIAHRSLLIWGSDGLLYRSGFNTYAGNGTGSVTGINVPTAFPTQPPLSALGIKSIELGSDGEPTYFVLDGDGTIHTMGAITYGNTGTGASFGNLTSWDKVGSGCPGGILTNVAKIGATGFTEFIMTSSAVLDNGSVRVWGSNSFNMITNGSNSMETCPIIPCGADTISGVLSIANGGHITPILASGGRICNIGHNASGGFGDGTSTDRDCYECITVPVLTTTNLCDEEDTCSVTPLFTFNNSCQGDTVFFTDKSTTNTGSINGWYWDFGDGVGSSTSQNPTYLYADTGTYEVTLIAYSDTSCADSIKINVVVNPLPVVIATLDTSICVGASANVMATGASTYVWDNGLPATAGPHNVSPITTTTYTVTGTDVNGCENDSSVTITVNPLPTITTADEAVCWEDS